MNRNLANRLKAMLGVSIAALTVLASAQTLLSNSGDSVTRTRAVGQAAQKTASAIKQKAQQKAKLREQVRKNSTAAKAPKREAGRRTLLVEQPNAKTRAIPFYFGYQFQNALLSLVNEDKEQSMKNVGGLVRTFEDTPIADGLKEIVSNLGSGTIDWAANRTKMTETINVIASAYQQTDNAMAYNFSIGVIVSTTINFMPLLNDNNVKKSVEELIQGMQKSVRESIASLPEGVSTDLKGALETFGNSAVTVETLSKTINALNAVYAKEAELQ